MSRLVSLLIVLLAIAVATPAIAEDRVKLSGQMRIIGHFLDDYDYNKDTKTGNSKYFSQRFRLQTTVAVAEGVTVGFRTDIGEGQWGNTRQVEVDHTWLQIDKEMFTLKAGRQYYGIGNTIAVDFTGTGALFTLKGQVPVQIGYWKARENTGTSVLNRDDDLDVYTVAVMHKTDMYNAVVFGGLARDGGNTAIEKSKKYLVGMQTNMNLDPVKLNFEFNYLTGKEDVTGGTKWQGMQAFLDASAAVADNVTVGGAVAFARGYKDSSSKTQLSNLAGQDFRPNEYGYMSGLLLDFSPITTFFDPSGNGKGVIGGMGYGQFKVMDDLSLRASVGYWRPQVKDDDLKSAITATASARYAVAARTTLDGQVFYTIPSFRGNVPDDNSLGLGFRLAVNF